MFFLCGDQVPIEHLSCRNTLEAHLRPGVPLLLYPNFYSPFKNEGRGFLSDLLPFGASFFLAKGFYIG